MSESMGESRLAENIVRYRKRKGLSQEKVSEYMGVSRQAVTKWETDLSRPSSDHLVRLAELLGVSVDALLGNGEEEGLRLESETGQEKVEQGGISVRGRNQCRREPAQEEIGIENQFGHKMEMGKIPWIFVGISASCMLTYVVNSMVWDTFSGGVFICMFLICVPIQCFLHIMFSNAVKNDSFSGIAGFDDKTEYHLPEVKKLLVQMDLQIGILSVVFIFLLCVINCMNFGAEWLNGLLIILYAMNFAAVVEFSNYKGIDRIYCREGDKRRARQGMPVTVIYTLLVFVGICITCVIFELKEIENNTWPAVKTCGLLLLGILAATTGFLLEHRRIRKQDSVNAGYKPGRAGILCLAACAALYVAMLIV